MAEQKKKPNVLGNIGYALSKGAAAFGQGLTGADYLGQFEKIEEARVEFQEKTKRQESFTAAKSKLAETDPTLVPALESLEQLGDVDAQMKGIKDLIVAQGKQSLKETEEPTPFQKAQEKRKGEAAELRNKEFKQGQLAETRRWVKGKMGVNESAPVLINTGGEEQGFVDEALMGEIGFDSNNAVRMGLAENIGDNTIRLKPAGERDRLLGQRTIPAPVQQWISEVKSDRDVLEQAIDEYKTLELDKIDGKDWNIIRQLLNPVGPVSAQAKSNMLRQFTNPDLATLSDKLERVFQQYRKRVTGAQASVEELKILRPLIINLTQNPETFMSSAEELLRETDTTLKNRIGFLRDAGKDEEVLSKFEKRLFGGEEKSKPSKSTKIGRFQVEVS